MQNDDAKKMKKKIYLYSALGMAVIILLVVFLQTSLNHTDSGEYYDKKSGETVSDPKGKSPEKVNSDPTTPVYLGFKKLVEVGISQYQQQGAMQALHEYSKKHNNSIKEISLTVNSVKTTLADPTKPDSRDYATFELTFNREQEYNAKLEYFNISAIQLYLYDKKTGKLVYTSPVIDTYESKSSNQEQDQYSTN